VSKCCAKTNTGKVHQYPASAYSHPDDDATLSAYAARPGHVCETESGGQLEIVRRLHEQRRARDKTQPHKSPIEVGKPQRESGTPAAFVQSPLDVLRGRAEARRVEPLGYSDLAASSLGET
jgi:hypothetical protein